MPADKQKHKSSILVFNHVPSLLKTYSLLLTEKGYEVKTAHTSSAAIDALRVRGFDLVLMDASSGNNADVKAALDYISTQLAGHCPAILLSGFSNQEALEQAQQRGIPVLLKPLEAEYFLNAVAAVLKRR